jgi:hypothetical protein
MIHEKHLRNEKKKMYIYIYIYIHAFILSQGNLWTQMEISVMYTLQMKHNEPGPFSYLLE